MQLLISKNLTLVYLYRFVKFEIFLFYLTRICDEEEEIPLHLRIKHTRSNTYPSLIPETNNTPTYNIDEYDLYFRKISYFLFFYINN